jgi:hypothetical protein
VPREAAWTATGCLKKKSLTEDMSRRTCICDMEGVLILKGNLVYLLSCYAVISGLVCDNNRRDLENNTYGLLWFKEI